MFGHSFFSHRSPKWVHLSNTPQAYMFRQNEFTLGWEFAKQRSMLQARIASTESQISVMGDTLKESTQRWMLGPGGHADASATTTDFYG
jgi:hypothetical protein